MTTASDPTHPRLVFVPGMACDADMWQAQIAALSAAGLTSRWQPQVSLALAAGDSVQGMAQALLDETRGALVICGASMGGIVAMEAARLAPERLAGLALFGTNARPETAEMRGLREQAIALYERPGGVEEVIRANVHFAFHPDHARDARLVQRYLDTMLRAGATTLIRQNRAIMARPDARLHLPRLRCPTLVVCGDADRLTPPDCSQEIASLVPGAQLQLVPRCGHMLTLEQPEAVNTLLINWLRTLG